MNSYRLRHAALFLVALPLLVLAIPWSAFAQAKPDTPAPPDAAASAPISLSARKVYEQARSQLLQIRTVLKGRASQTSVGAGFLVSRDVLQQRQPE